MSWQVAYLLGIATAALIFAYLKTKERISRKNADRRKAPDGQRTMSNAVEYELAMGPFIVALGGGTGLSTLLHGLKSFTRNITAIVTVTDEGGSSGRLKQEWGVLPPGDVRNCIVALAENDNALKRLLDFRFDRGELQGHSLGNLMLLAVTELHGDFRTGVEEMNNLLAIRGRVLPVTTEVVSLVGEEKDGGIIRGELEISAHGRFLQDIRLEPADAKPLPEVLRAISDADMIVLGPGSLFTSIIPNLLVPHVSRKIRESRGPVVYVANLMTQPNETEGMSLLDHVQWIAKILGKWPVYVIVNDSAIEEPLLGKYRSEGAVPLYLSTEDEMFLQNQNCRVFRGHYVQIHEGILIRHDGLALSETLMRIQRSSGED